jgi:hypothetical protein
VCVCKKRRHMHDNNKMSTQSASLLSCMSEACARSRWDLSGEEMAVARNGSRCARTTRQACKVLVLWFSCTMAWGRHRGVRVDIGGVGACTRAKDVHNKHETSTRCARFVLVVHARVHRSRGGAEEVVMDSGGTRARRRRPCVHLALRVHTIHTTCEIK